MRPARLAVAATTAAVLLWPASQAAASTEHQAASAAESIHTMPSDAATSKALADGTETSSVAPAMLAGLGAAVAEDKLEAIRGGAELVVNDMRLDGAVANNTANRVITGSNTISDGAFANASGLPTVIQNSGANTLIQNATILNVRFGP